MNPADFRAPQAGKVIRIPTGYFAFIPAPLPPEIVFFLTGVKETAQQALRQTSILVDLRESYYKQLLGFPKAANLIDQLFVNPYITVGRAEKELKISNPTARKAIEIMEKRGILREITGRDWGKIYFARAIADAIQNPS